MKNSIITVVAAAALGLAAQANAAVDAVKAQELAKSKNCFACHMVDKKLVGPHPPAYLCDMANYLFLSG